MVFCSFREGVAEIVVCNITLSHEHVLITQLQNTLNEANPLIRAHKFVGRANASKDDSDKGLTQKEQKEVRRYPEDSR
jgi:ERCC4-related helicase